VLAYPFSSMYLGLIALSAGAFFVQMASPCTYALSMDMGGRATAVVFGVMNMAGNIGSWVFASFIPALVHEHVWEPALLVFLGLHLVAIVFTLLINPDGVIGERAGEKNLSAG
jgi:ACS family glucarate transporter-like MFS transporter